jgi:hypothetical protein
LPHPTPAAAAPRTINEPSIEPSGKQKKARQVARPAEVAEQVWADWLQLRKGKRAAVTQTVVEGAIDEAAKAGMSLEDFLRVWCKRGSQGLEAAWLRPNERGGGVVPVNRQEALEARNRAVGDAWLRDQEAMNATG